MAQDRNPAADAAQNAAWSPDGRFIAYVTRERGLGLVEVDSGVEMTIEDGIESDVGWGQLAWTPDGYSVLYGKVSSASGRVGRWIAGTDGQRNLLTEDAADVALSPDGKHIAFRREPDGPPSNPLRNGWPLFIANLDGSGERQVTDSSFLIYWGESGPWSPDSRFLAHWQTNIGGSAVIGEMYAYDLMGGGQIPVGSFTDDEQPQWSPVEREAIFHNLLIDVQLGTTKPLFDRPGAVVSWAPDGEKLAVVDGHPFGQPPRDLVIPNVTTGERTVLHSSEANMAHAGAPGYYGGWSADSRYFAFVSYDRDEKNGADVFVANGRTGTTTAVMTTVDYGDVRVAYSPDGSRLLIQDARFNSSTIWTANADGSGLEKVADGVAVGTPPWWPTARNPWRP